MTAHNIEALTRRLVDLDAQIGELAEQRKAIVAVLTDAIEVGGAVAAGGHTYYRVAQRRTFSVDKARELVPPELIEAATVPTLDQNILRSLMPPALVDACRVPGVPFLEKARS